MNSNTHMNGFNLIKLDTIGDKTKVMNIIPIMWIEYDMTIWFDIYRLREFVYNILSSFWDILSNNEVEIIINKTPVHKTFTNKDTVSGSDRIANLSFNRWIVCAIDTAAEIEIVDISAEDKVFCRSSWVKKYRSILYRGYMYFVWLKSISLIKGIDQRLSKFLYLE